MLNVPGFQRPRVNVTICSKILIFRILLAISLMFVQIKTDQALPIPKPVIHPIGYNP